MSRPSLSISVRRHFVDRFFFAHQNLIQGKVLDVGGKKHSKRGNFDVDKLRVEVIYVNTEEKELPDILADASQIPVPDSSFDTVLLGEVMEHLPDPKQALQEAYRILKPEGRIIATVPFLYPIHADPYDFGRYTGYFWQEAARKLGFKNVKVESQGGMFAVLALMVQHFCRSRNKTYRPIQQPLVRLLMWLDHRTKNELLKSWTTGYGLIFEK